MDDQIAADLRKRMLEAFAAASVEYQKCQLDAQRADLAGDDLAAAILRSISESQTGTAHALLRLMDRLGQSEESSSRETAVAVRSALERSVKQREAMAAITDLAATIEPRTLRDDLQGVAVIGSTNAMRLKGLLAKLDDTAAPS